MAADDTAALAERRDFEERYKRMVAELEDMKDAYRALQKRTSDLASEVARLRDENLQHTQAQTKYATREDLRKLVEKMQEIDSKRESDRKLVLEQLEKLANTTANSFAALESRPQRRQQEEEKKPVAPPVDPNQEYYTYVVEPGNTLSDIVNAYNEDFKKNGKKRITVQQVLQANPGLKPERIFAGKKILIPVPGPQ